MVPLVHLQRIKEILRCLETSYPVGTFAADACGACFTSTEQASSFNGPHRRAQEPRFPLRERSTSSWTRFLGCQTLIGFRFCFRTMTLNPSAQVFVPSSQTLKLLKETSLPTAHTEKDLSNHTYSPPQLESLYIDLSGCRDEEDMFSSQSHSVGRSIDYTNFDVSPKRVDFS